MKYAVIVGPVDKDGREGVSGIHSWESFWTFNGGRKPATAQDWTERLRLPAKQAPTLKFDIYLPDDRDRKNKVIGLANVQRVDFSNRSLLLWLPNELFPSHVPPDTLTVQRTNFVANSEGNTFFARRRAEGIGTPEDVLTKVAKGTLFERSEKKPTETGSLYFLRIVSEDEVAGKREKGESVRRGIYNPWTMVLDTAKPFVSGEGDPSRAWLAEEMDQGAVDFHIDVPAEDRLRVRVHAGLSLRWANEGGERERPVIPRLLFGAGAPSPALTRAFAVLDSLHGEFRVEGFAAPEAQHPRLIWIPPDGPCSAARLMTDRLVLEAAHLLALEVPEHETDGDAEAEGSAVVEGGAEGLGGAEDTGEEETLSDVLDRQFTGKDRVPPILVTLAESLSKVRLDRLSVSERGEVERAVRAGDNRNLLRSFAAAHLLPRSRIRVCLPAPPEWLDPDAREKWKSLRARQLYDPAAGEGVVAEGETRRRLMPVWWLRLIQPGEESTVSGAYPWEAWSYFWKSQFHVALFRAPSRFVPTWKPPDPGGQLGGAVLGEDLQLGTFMAEQTKTSFPDMHLDRWPLIIEV